MEIKSQNNMKNLNMNFRFFSFFTRDGWFFALCQWSLWVQWDWVAREINQSLRTKWSNPDCNQISLLNTWIATASPRDHWLSLQTIVRLRDLGIQPPLSFGHLPLSGEKNYLMNRIYNLERLVPTFKKTY